MTKLTQERLTRDAQHRLDEYLRQVHAALSGCRSVSADEVERDIRDHIESALPADEGPVSLHDLEGVLYRLGRPTQWVPQEERPWWRRFLMRCRSGPEDWRLAYLAFALLVLGYVFPVLIVASYLVARAALEVARGQNEDVGAQRWFIYPSLLIVDVALVGMVLLGLPLTVVRLGFQAHIETYHNEVEISLAFASAAFAVWWLILGIVLAIWPRIVQVTVQPWGDGFERKHARYLIFTGLGLGVLWGIAALIRGWLR